MAKVKVTSGEPTRKVRPALTPEARENQMISLAVDLAEKQLLNGSASSQVITHYLKLGTVREQLERERLEKENALLVAKVDALQSQKRSEELFQEAIAAMRRYSGHGSESEEEYED